ncbi:hypothetical protein [Streptomyces sp. NPDC055055]
MSRTLLRLDSIACLHRDGETERARRTATVALKSRLPACSIDLTNERGMDLLHSPTTTTNRPSMNSRRPWHETRAYIRTRPPPLNLPRSVTFPGALSVVRWKMTA